MFKFKFNKSDNETEETNDNNSIQWHEAKEVIPQDEQLCKQISEDDSNIKIFECNIVKLKYISSDIVIVNLMNSDNDASSILKAETNHSDLVTGEYEGGLKIWECTSDLINHLSMENITFANKKVLDLGCGAGLLGIYALLQGSLVDFQDYNNEVIEYTTIPNVALNLNYDDAKLKSCKFYSGDWKSFMNLVNCKYDYILTSETIYNPENYRKLLDIFNQLLEPDGIMYPYNFPVEGPITKNYYLTNYNRYLAAKTYYFGVGGSLRQFEELLNKDGILSTNICWKNSSGVQREILKIFKK